MKLSRACVPAKKFWISFLKSIAAEYLTLPSVLAEFQSAVSAMVCAAEFQKIDKAAK